VGLCFLHMDSKVLLHNLLAGLSVDVSATSFLYTFPYAYGSFSRVLSAVPWFACLFLF
jgi:hypothetical protein